MFLQFALGGLRIMNGSVFLGDSERLQSWNRSSTDERAKEAEVF